MTVQKLRWSRVYESSEEELIELLEAQNIDAERWTIDAFEPVALLQHDHRITMWCAEGSIIFHINGKDISIQPGDILKIPAKISYSADAGMTGCAIYQAS